MNLPHVAKHAFGDQMGPNVQNPMPFGSLPHQGLKIADFPKKNIFLFFRHFFGPTGVTFAVFALLAIFRGWYTL